MKSLVDTSNEKVKHLLKEDFKALNIDMGKL